MDAVMRCLAIMGAFVETALNAKKMARSALRLAKLHCGLHVHSSAIKCSTQIRNVSMASLEAREVQGDPFANMFNAYFHQMVQINRKI
jgi:hypothetical protein